jgi:hypothetical protein
MWHPFKVGQTADSCLKAAKRRQTFRHRVAKNDIIDYDEGRLVMEWYFAPVTLEIAWDENEEAYAVRALKPPLVTGIKLSTAQAAMSSDEVAHKLEALRSVDG